MTHLAGLSQNVSSATGQIREKAQNAMATKLNTTEIKSDVPASPDGSVRRVLLEDGADLTIHRDLLDRNSHGRAFSFTNLGFETSADKARRERGMVVRETNATVATE